MKLGGIDVGTTGCKLTVYREDGTLLSKAYVGYDISRVTGEHEIDGSVIWNGVKAVIRETAEQIGSIDAIGITTFGESFVMLDQQDNVLMPTMLYTDPRGEAEAASFDEETVIEIAGVKPHSMYSLPKIMWIKNNRPEIYEKADKILLFEDFIVYMLTGVAQIDYSLAARTMGLDIRTLQWSDRLFEIAGVDVGKMSKPVLAGSVAGKVKPSLCKELGLQDTLIINGCHDQVASAVGAGVFRAGEAVDGTGTVECITPVFDEIPQNKALYHDSYCVVPYVEKGKYVCYAFSFTGGAAVKWFRDQLAEDLSYRELDALVDTTPGEILLLPHFAGAATPYMDAHSKAAFVGVTLETTKADLYKAVMEGVTYEMLLNINRLKQAHIQPKKLYATGGGASSAVWLKMKANILGIPIVALDAPEVGALGTVMLVGVAIGAFEDLYDAARVMVKEKGTYDPDPTLFEQHAQIYKRYEKLYDAVRPLLENGKE